MKMTKNKIQSLRVAIVADWLTSFGGAEKVIESFVHLFPEAPLYTTVFDSEAMKSLGNHPDVRTSFLQKFPKCIRKKHRSLLPLLPKAIESLNLNDFDLVISSSSFVAKGVITNPETLHICYCHTPARFLWGEWQEFLKNYPLPAFIKYFLPPVLSRLRIWDKYSAERPDLYIANSDFIQQRIKKYWQKDSLVLPPPVDIDHFSLKQKKDDYFLFVGRLVAQKSIDFLVETFKELPKEKIKIIGTGPMKEELKKLAEGHKNIDFLGYVDDEKLPEYFAQAKAVIFPHVEDAGIVPLESLASGTPVIALKKGGVLTTLNEEVAVFFDKQKKSDLKKAINDFDSQKFIYKKLRSHAEKFSKEKFEEELLKIITEEWEKFSKNK